MSQAFNLTAQINLQAPANLKTVVAGIRRELGTVDANIKLNVSQQSAKSITGIKNRIDALNASLIQARNNVTSLDTTLKNLSSSLTAVSGSTGKIDTGFANTSRSVGQTAKNIKVATDEMAEFGKQSALAIRRFAAFSIVSTGVMALVGAVTSGFRAFVEFDKEMIRLQQVTGKGEIGLRGLEKEIRNLSTTLGVSSKSLVEVASTLAQAGLSAEDTRIALAALAKTELAPSFDNITDTTEGAIAAIRQFGLEAKDLEKALGSINAVAAAFAVESKDIIAAIQRTGGVFAASSKGVSEGTQALNEFVAVFTSIRQTTRESAETIATGLRTIFTRIQRAKTIDQLREFGVELTDLEGKFVGPYEAVKRLSAALGSLDPRDLRFSQIVEELGGFRQIGKVIPLIQQFKVAQEALNVAQKGQGSLYAAQITAQKSLAIQLAKVRENFLELIADIGKSKSFQSLFKIVVGLASGLIRLASAFKPILPILAIFGAIKGISALTRFSTGFVGGLRKGGGLAAAGNNLGSSLSGAKEKETSDATQKASQAITENTTALKTLTTAINSLSNNVLENTKRLASNNGQTLNSGGVVRKFARGGLVPGSGDGDTVPAMLEAGEFVIRKKAVQKLGAGNLHKINKYAGGGTVSDYAESRPFVNRETTFDKEPGKPIYEALRDTPKLLLNKKDKLDVKIDRQPYNGKELAQKVINTQAAKKYLNAKNDQIRGFAFEDLLKEAGIIAQKGGGGSRIDAMTPNGDFAEIKSTKNRPSDKDLLSKAAGAIFDPVSKTIDIAAMKKASKTQLSSKIDNIGFGTLHEFYDSAVRKKVGGLIRKFANGGLLQKFMAGGLATVPKSRSEIFKKLPLLEAARAAGIDSIKAYDVMGLRRAPTPEEAGWIEAIQKEYIKKVNRKTGAQNATTTKLENAGLVFGAAGLFGKAFSPVNQTIKSDRLSESRKVRILSGVMDPNKASEILSIFSQGVGDITSRASSSIRSPGDINSSKSASPFDINLESTIQGGLLQKAIEALGGPTAIKGKGFDFPEGLQGAAKYFGLPPDIPTDVKRTLTGPSTIKDNIVTYLKNVMGYYAGGLIQKFATGGSSEDTVPALLTPGEFVINKKAAQKIGYSKLHKMNKADKLQGYNTGGIVQHFGSGSTGNGAQPLGPSPVGVTEKQLGLILKVLIAQEKNTRTQGGQKLIKKIEEVIAKQSLGVISASEAIVDVAAGIRSFAIENKKGGNDDRANSLKRVFESLDKLQQSRGGSSLIQATNSRLGINVNKKQTIVGQFPPTPTPPGGSGPTPPSGPSSPTGSNTAHMEAKKRKEEQDEYFAYRAKESGQSVGRFRSTLASKVVTREKDLAENLKNKQTGFRYAALGQSNSLKGSTDKEQLKAAKAEFAAKLKEIDPSRSSAEIDKAAKRLVISLRKGSDSFDTIVKNDTVLSEILNKTRTSAENAAIAFDEVAKENGLTADVLREQISSKGNKQYRQQKFIQSDVGQNFGRLAQMAPDAIAKFAGTTTGQKLNSAADFTSGKGIISFASKKLGDGFGNALDGWMKKLGGPMTILGAGLSVLGDKLPDINASLGYGQSETAAGVAGGISGAGQGLASGALLGSQIAGPVGALVGGISGAIIKGITGVFNGINNKRLENNLRGLEKATTSLDSAFKKLDESATDNSLREANSRFADTLNSLAKVGSQANFGAGGLARTVTETLRGIDPTGLVSAVTGGETEAESRQALVSGLGRATSDADRLGSYNISRASTESISRLLDNANASGDKTTAFARANQGYQAMRQARMGEQEIFLSKYITQQNQQGRTPEQISKELSDPKKKEEAIKQGKELLAVDGELALKQALVARTAKDLMIANEQLLEVYRKASAGLDRYSKELERFDNQASSAANDLTGNARMQPVRSKNEEILNNISAYSTAEVSSAADEAASVAGGGDAGSKLKNDIMTSKLLKDELPKALRGVSGNNTDEVIDKLNEAFKNMNVEFPDSLKKQLSEGLASKTVGNREGSGLSDLANEAGSIIEEIFKGPEAGLKFAQELLSKYNETINKSIEKQTEYNDVLDRAQEFQRKAVNIRLNAELDLARALGKSPTLKELNKPIDVEMRSMTSSLIPGGSTDPTQINNALNSSAEAKKKIEARLANPTMEAYGVKTEEERAAAVKKDLDNLTKHTKAVNDGNRALEKLANDGTKAANALAKIQERQQLGENARSLGRKLLTSDSSELADFSRQMGAYNRVISGKASNRDLSNLQTRKDAFAGLDNIKGLIPESMAKQMEARLQRQMIMANPRGQEILKSVVGVDSEGKPMTMDDALKQAETGKDPVQEEYIKAYKDATEVQARAAQALADNALKASEILAKASQEMLDKISKLGEILPSAQAEAAAAKPEAEKPKDPTGDLSDKAAGAGTINIPGLSNVADSNKQLIDAIKALIAAIVALKIAYMASKAMGMFKNMPGMPKMTGLGLKQITGPMSGGAGAFGTSAGGGAAGVAAGAATAAGAAYGGFVALDWLNSINELMNDFDGKMSELNSRASKQLEQGYFQNVLQNLMEPGDSLIDLFSGLDELTGNMVGSAVGLKNSISQRAAEVEKTIQNMEENAKTKKGVVDEKTGEMTMVERDKNDHMRGIGLSDQIDVRQSARLMFEIKKAKEAKNSGKSVRDFEQITGADAGAYRNQDFDTIIKEKEKQLLDRNKGKKDTTQLKDARDAELRQLEQDANNRVADAKKEAATVAATKPETVSEKPKTETATPETPKPQTEAETTKKADGAAKPESSTTETTKDTKKEEVKPKDSLEASSNNKPVYMTVLEKIASLLTNKSSTTIQTTNNFSQEEIKKLEEIGAMDNTIGVNADGSRVSIGQTIYGSNQQNPQNITQSQASEAEEASPQISANKKVSDLSIQQSYRFRQLMMKGKLRASEDGLPIGRTSEEEKEYETLAQQKKDANPQIVAKIRERELKNKGKLRISEDGLPIGRNLEEEKEYGQIVSNKPLTPYQQAQQSKREAYLSRFRPEVRARMLNNEERTAERYASTQNNTATTPEQNNPTAVAGNNLPSGPIPSPVSAPQPSQYTNTTSSTENNNTSSTGYSITLDENSRKFLETFSTTINSFGNYMNQLSEISTRFKDKIEVTGDYTVQVNLSGAAAIEALDKKMKEMAESIVSKSDFDLFRGEVSRAVPSVKDPAARGRSKT